MAVQCANSFKANSIALQRGCFTKTLILIQCFAAMRQSVGLLSDSLLFGKTKMNTHTHNYCNPTVHALRVNKRLQTRVKNSSQHLKVYINSDIAATIRANITNHK